MKLLRLRCLPYGLSVWYSFVNTFADDGDIQLVTNWFVGILERYYLLFNHQELEQLKHILTWKSLAIKVTKKYKNSNKCCYHWEKKITIRLTYTKNIFRWSYWGCDISHMVYQCAISLQRHFCRWWWYTTSHRLIW